MELSIKNIEVVYSGVVLALSGVSLRVCDGQVVVLLGSNGSGKSTTLKSISGVLRAEEGKVTEGSISFNGRSLHKEDPETVARLGIRHVLQGHPVFPQLTVEENLLMGAYLRRDKEQVKKDMGLVFEYFPPLRPLRLRRSGYLSGGEQQMLVIGRAIMARPRLMLLDEPSLGLAPMVIAAMFPVLKRINKEEGVSLLIAEQNASAAISIADYGYVLQNGNMVLEGNAEALAQEVVRESYLGTDGKGTDQSYYAGMKKAS